MCLQCKFQVTMNFWWIWYNKIWIWGNSNLNLRLSYLTLVKAKIYKTKRVLGTGKPNDEEVSLKFGFYKVSRDTLLKYKKVNYHKLLSNSRRWLLRTLSGESRITSKIDTLGTNIFVRFRQVSALDRLCLWDFDQ